MPEKESPGQNEEADEKQSAGESKKKFSLETFGRNITETFETIKREYPSEAIKKQADGIASQTKHYLDKTGVTETVSKAYGATQEHLDTVTGARLIQLVEERMELQGKYNDVLATKLAEALKRIDALEKRIAG